MLRRAPKEAPRARDAGGGGGGVAVVASRATAHSGVKRADSRTQRLNNRPKSRAPMKPIPTRTNPKNNQARRVPINRKAANGGPGVADVEAVAGAAAGLRMGLPDRLPMSLNRRRRRRPRARLPISTDILRKPRSRPYIPKRMLFRRSNRLRTNLRRKKQRGQLPRPSPTMKRRKPPRGGARPCARGLAS